MKNVDVRFTEIRMTSYVLICAIERDLRGIIFEELVSRSIDADFLFDSKERCIERYKKDNKAESSYNIVDIIEYLDFQEAYTVLLKNKDTIDTSIHLEIKRISPILDKISPIRNIVMHGRPLDYDDYLLLSNFCTEVPTTNGVRWTFLKAAVEELASNPLMLMKVEIPERDSVDRIFNNLPKPDFNDTGFIGRKNEVKDIKELIYGNHRVVSIIGDGGTGKTAIALKVAYEILDDEKSPYEMIIWGDAKQNILTEQGVVALKDEINHVRFFHDIKIKLSGEISVESDINEIIENLKNYSTLLILDNLETIINENVLQFVREASKFCKILITSRIGIGELEFRRIIAGLTDKEATILDRQYAKYCGLYELLKLDTLSLKNILCKQLYNSPLAIKWYIKCIASGVTPAETINNKGELLKFCLSNVYSHLELNEKKLISILLVMRKVTSEAELIYLSELDPIQAKKSINRLLATSFVNRNFEQSNSGSTCLYDIPEFARQYLVSEKIVSSEQFKVITDRKRKLTGVAQNARRLDVQNIYNIYAISMENESEIVVGRILSEVLAKSNKNHHSIDGLIEDIERAKSIVPGYSEIYRISAFIKAENGDTLGAEQDYITGLNISIENKRLMYFYCGFLLRHMDDAENALEYSKKLIALDSDSPFVKILHARCLGYTGDYETSLDILGRESKNDIGGTAKTRKMAFHHFIEIARRLANSYQLEQHDYINAVKIIRRVSHLFSERAVYGDIDDKISSSFTKLLNDMWCMIKCNATPDQLNWFKLFVKNHQDHFMNISPSIVSDESSCLSVPQNTYLGVIEKLFEKYGFISSNSNLKLFFHISECQNFRPSIGNHVRFELGFNNQGKAAVCIEKVP